jgi:hypothetical protein
VPMPSLVPFFDNVLNSNVAKCFNHLIIASIKKFNNSLKS